jgi:uncharacterized membrane-anchored protein
MKLKLLLLVLALQSAWLLGTVVVQEHALASGKVILLETERADPRDLLRGDHLVLRYKISTVPSNLFSPPANMNLPSGTEVYVALERRGAFYQVAKASTNSLTPAAGEIVLRGKRSGERGNSPADSFYVQFGIERFYITKGAEAPAGEITVQAVVPASGQARIKEVFLNGRPYAEAMKEPAR